MIGTREGLNILTKLNTGLLIEILLTFRKKIEW